MVTKKIRLRAFDMVGRGEISDEHVRAIRPRRCREGGDDVTCGARGPRRQLRDFDYPYLFNEVPFREAKSGMAPKWQE